MVRLGGYLAGHQPYRIGVSSGWRVSIGVPGAPRSLLVRPTVNSGTQSCGAVTRRRRGAHRVRATKHLGGAARSRIHIVRSSSVHPFGDRSRLVHLYAGIASDDG